MTFIDSSYLELTTQDVYRAMGTGLSFQNITPNLMEKINQYNDQARNLIACAYAWKKVTVSEITDSTIILNDSLEITCKPIYFLGATEAAVMLLTVGSAIEQEIKRMYVNTYLLDGLILEAYANIALDELLGFVRADLEKETTPCLQKLGYTLSPGSQLAFEDQAVGFSILKNEAEEMGIHLLDSFAMHPGKTVCYFIPIGQSLALPSHTRYSCSICSAHRSCLFSPIATFDES